MTLYQGPCTKCGFFGVISSTRTICNRCNRHSEDERFRRNLFESAPPFVPRPYKEFCHRCGKELVEGSIIQTPIDPEGVCDMGPCGGGKYCSLECSRQ